MPKQLKKRREPPPPLQVTVTFKDPVNGPARLTAALVEIGRTKPAPPPTKPTAEPSTGQ